MSGLDSTGFTLARLDEIKASIEDDFRSEFGNNVRVDAETVNGQIIGIMSDRISSAWELIQKVYAYAYLDSAEGSALDDLVAFAGIARSAATYSTVTLTLLGVDGTIIPAGSRSKDSLGTLWVHDSDVTIAGGAGSTTAKPQTTGPIRALSGSITIVDTPVSGWTATLPAVPVNNVLDAVEGLAVESDAKLRQKYKLAFFLGLGSSADAIRAALLRITDVTEALVIANKSLETDADGRPGKSFEAVVRGGDDTTISGKIWLCGPAGIETFGNTSKTVVDGHGDAQTVNFSRPIEVPVYIKIDLEIQPGFPDDGEDLVRDEILAYVNAFFIGQSVFPFKIAQHIETDFIENASIYVGLSSSPSDPGNLTIGRNELARFDSGRIEINRV